MAKPDWGALQNQFLAEHAKSGISPKDWCEAQGLNYASAKRYIKIANGGANSQKKSANKTANSQKGNATKRRASAASGEKCESNKPSSPPETKPDKPTRKVVTNHPPFQPGNQHALKHGGYGRRLLLADDVTEDAKALTLDDELFWLRAANLTAAANIGRWTVQLDDADSDMHKKLKDDINSAEKAMLRNTVRIESLERTKAGILKSSIDGDYRIVATEKVGLEVDKLRRDAGTDDGNGERDLNDFYSDNKADTESGASSVLDDTGA